MCREIYNPFSVYTIVPWAVLFNISEALLMIALDALIGPTFNDTVKAWLCLVLFILNMGYILYTIVIHVNLFYMKPRVKKRKDALYPITMTDLLNILIAGPLIWIWLFLSLYFFDHAMYTDVVTRLNKPHMFFNVYFKFLAYTLVALNGATTTIIPILTLSELAEGFSALYYQVTSVIVLAGLLTYWLNLLEDS